MPPITHDSDSPLSNESQTPNTATPDDSSGVFPCAVSFSYPHQSARLKVRKQFLGVASGGLKAIASTLVVQGSPVRSVEEGGIRVGFTVTKKTGNSVIRNRIRRRLRAAVAADIAHYGTPGWDYVVIGRNTALDAPYEIICRDLRYALRKVSKTKVSQEDVNKR